MSFNPNTHLIKVNGKDYLQVQWRLCWFRALCPQGTIDTEEIVVDPNREVTAEVEVWNPDKRRKEKITKTGRGYARYKATVTDGKGGRATAHGSETAVDFPDYTEKAETKALGRALAGLGFGTQFTGDEFNEAHRIVDAPVERVSAITGEAEQKLSTAEVVQEQINRSDSDAPPATDKQLQGIRKLCTALKKEPPAPSTLTETEASSLIVTLTNEYKATRARAAALSDSTR